jgi:hypothetical protein
MIRTHDSKSYLGVLTTPQYYSETRYHCGNPTHLECRQYRLKTPVSGGPVSRLSVKHVTNALLISTIARTLCPKCRASYCFCFVGGSAA